MSDYSISSISSVSTMVRTSEAQPAAPQSGVMPAFPSHLDRAETVGPVAAKQGLQAPAQVDPAAPKQMVQKQAEQKAAAEVQEQKLPINNLDSVMIRFSIDEKTKNITVYVIDKVSKRVVRAIPPEDLNKMQAGDLLQLLA